MKNQWIEEVYNTLNGAMAPGSGAPGVENAFAKGEICEVLYGKVFAAARRLEERLDADGEDEDLETIIDALLDIQQEMCYRMYCYGAKFGMRGE